jgi:GNAT superfamily N-acetyltransferase
MNMLECKVFKGEQAQHGAAVALMNELHMPDHYQWELRTRLLTVKAGDHKAAVAIAYKDGAPVSCVLVRLMRNGQHGYDVAAYCKEQHRLQGITSKLIEALKTEAVPIPEAATGIEGTHHFWNKNGIDCPPIYY